VKGAREVVSFVPSVSLSFSHSQMDLARALPQKALPAVSRNIYPRAAHLPFSLVRVLLRRTRRFESSARSRRF